MEDDKNRGIRRTWKRGREGGKLLKLALATAEGEGGGVRGAGGRHGSNYCASARLKSN